MEQHDHEDTSAAGFVETDDVMQAQQARDREEQRKKLASKEHGMVKKMRLVVFSVLLVATVVCCGLVYRYVSDDQQDDFETSFASNGAKVVEAFHKSMELKLSAYDSLSSSFTSFAAATGQQFPFVTLSDYEVRGSIARVSAQAMSCDFAPIVQEEDRYEWVEWAQNNSVSLFEAAASDDFLRHQQDAAFGLIEAEEAHPPDTDTGSDEPAPLPMFASDINIGGKPVPNGTGPYAPIWQMTPVVPPLALFNLYVNPSRKAAAEASLKSGKATIASNAYVDLNDPPAKFIFGALLSQGQYRHNDFSYLDEGPVTSILYPVFDTFLPDKKVVGHLNTVVMWKLLFFGILPDEVNGIVCVMENSFNESFTYELNGSRAKFLGPEDLHDPAYDNMVISVNVFDYLEDNASPETSSLTVVGFDSEFSSYTLKVYPSKATEEQFITNRPIYVTLLIAGVFLVTAGCFLAFNLVVERRQKVIMNRAIASGAIVRQLYPEEVVDRLYDHDAGGNNKDGTIEKTKNDWKAGGESVDNFMNKVENTSEVATSKAAIADKYLCSTVFFADVAGFTRWSATREASAVFELLETIYESFDKLALRRNVFKVETIGDCYMAVTGVPKPDPNHAVVMTKFARDCILHFNMVTERLRSTLGEDTKDLALRVGLNSGPVTAGVLRGQKARFQLFGDTVNTASRMESNSLPGRIHVSESTANELIAKGKGDWLTEREDKIIAKGKGEMKTFWVDPRPAFTYAKSTSGSLQICLETTTTTTM